MQFSRYILVWVIYPYLTDVLSVIRNLKLFQISDHQ